MKKILCAVLAALLLFGCIAVAEEAAPVETLVYDELTVITYQIPEGFTVEASEMLDTTAHVALMKDTFNLDLLVAHDEEYAELEKLNDLSEEEFDQYAASLTEDWLNPQVQVLETAYGTKFILIKEDTDAEMDVALITGIYKGFLMTVSFYYEDGLKLDSSDFDAAMNFLSEVWVKDAE